MLFIQRPREVADFVARHPRVLPGPPEAPALSANLLRSVLGLMLMLVVLVALAATFFLFGEERDRTPLRPALTARQRANAFRSHAN